MKIEVLRTPGCARCLRELVFAALPTPDELAVAMRERRASVLAHVVLGGAAGLAGLGVQALLGRHWGLVLGPWLLLMGLLWPGWVRLPFKGLPLRARRATTVWGSPALGALGWIG